MDKRELEVHKQDMKFSKEVETIWSEISKSWNMDFLLMNYVEVNEFKLCIEKGLNKIK